MGTAIGDIRWTYLSAVLRYRQVNRPWKHILLKVITDWCYSSADWHLNLCKTAVQLTRLPKGHLFTANTAEQKHLIAFELSISKYGERSNSFSLMVLFFKIPASLLSLFLPFGFWCFHQAHSLLCLLRVPLALLCSLPSASNLLIFQCVCSSLCNSATVCQYANEVAAYGSFLI